MKKVIMLGLLALIAMSLAVPSFAAEKPTVYVTGIATNTASTNVESTVVNGTLSSIRITPVNAGATVSIATAGGLSLYPATVVSNAQSFALAQIVRDLSTGSNTTTYADVVLADTVQVKTHTALATNSAIRVEFIVK